ncbi:MAG TPA: glycosyltransferase family 4 protein [Rhodanobacteraceae bacterium]|nr:glycosyltransferase family 4 protein [Rhodanobacteraceae bacterium]
MRILVISDLPQFVTGGAEKQAANLIEAWLEAGNEVTCFGRRMGAEPVHIGRHLVPARRIRTLQRAGRLLRGASYFFSLSLLLVRHRGQFDLVYTRFLGEAAVTACLLKSLRLVNAALVATPANTGGRRGGDAGFLASVPCRNALVRLLDAHCDAINLIAPAMAAELRKIGFSGRNFSHIPNGVAVRADAPPHSQRRHMFLAVGRVARQKGYDVLIEALALIKNRLRPGMVRIAGDGAERPQLQARAAQLKVADAIEWLGELDHASVLRELEDAKVLLLPSRYEGMSNAGLEAMERGLAMLMTRCGGLDTYVQPDMGWVIEPGDAESLAAAIEASLSSSAQSLQSMGSCNRACVLQRFALATVATRYLELFSRLVAARSAGTP